MHAEILEQISLQEKKGKTVTADVAARMFELCQQHHGPGQEMVTYSYLISAQKDYYTLQYIPQSGLVAECLQIQFHLYWKLYETTLSFSCTSQEILERGMACNEPYIKVYHPYYDVATGKRRWMLCRSTAPRTLRHAARDHIPAFKSEWVAEVDALTELGAKRLETATDEFAAQWRERKLFLVRFFNHMTLDGYAPNSEFSQALLRHWAYNWVHIKQFLITPAHAHWTERQNLDYLREFLGRLDPSVEAGGRSSQLEQQFRDLVLLIFPDHIDAPDNHPLGIWNAL